jgi:O-antigen/teichoic acid export membrane protein
MTTSRTSRAFAGTITSLLQYAFIIVLQFLLAPIVLRTAGQEVLGVYAFLMQVISWTALTDLGFGVAIGRNLAQATGIDDHRQHFRKIFTTGRTFLIASNLTGAVLILILSWKVKSFLPMSNTLESDAQLSLNLLALWVAMRTPFALYNDALFATQNLAAANTIVGIGTILRLFFSLALVISGIGLIGLILANIIAEVVSYIVGYGWYRKCFPNDKFGWGIPDRKLFRKMFRFGITYMVMIVAGRLSSSTDSIIVGSLFGATSVSIYYTSQTPGTMLYQMFWKLTDNSAPALNELHARGAAAQLSNAYLRLLRYSLLLVIPFSLGLTVFNRSAVTLWVGSEQYAGDVLTIALAFFALTQVVIHLNAIVLVAYDNILVMSIFGVCGGIVKVLLAYWLGGIVGLQGVMIANAIVDIPVLIFLSYFVWRLLGLSSLHVWRSAVVPAMKAGIFTLPVLILILINPPIVTWISFFVWGSIFAFTFVLGIGSVGLLSSERDIARLYIKRVLKFCLLGN